MDDVARAAADEQPAVEPTEGSATVRPSRLDLDRSVVSGVAWTAGMRSLSQGVQWAAAIVVVRFLTPADYGLVAMATAYLGLVNMFTEFGLGSAIIQRRNLSADQVAHLGGVSLAMSTFFAVVSIVVSGLVADFFHEPPVRLIVMVLSVTFVLNGAGVVSRSLMTRDREFRRLTWSEVVFNLTYAATSLILAVTGFGYWSLVLGAVVGTVGRLVTVVLLRPHPIAWPRDIGSVKAELWFGWHVAVGRFARYLRKFSDVLVVSKIFGTDAVGIYNVAWTQANIPVDRGTNIVTEVTPPILAAVQDDPPALRRYIRVFTEGIALLSFPATIGLALVADDFVMLVFGERWALTIAPLRVLAFVAAMRSVTPILTQVLVATDQTQKSMRFGVAAAIIMPFFLLGGSLFGLTGVAMGWLLGHPFVVATILLGPALRAARMPLTEYLRIFRPAIVASVTMVVAVVAVRVVMPGHWPLAVRFGIEVSVGVLAYGLQTVVAYGARVRAFVALMRANRRRPAAATADEGDVGGD